MPNGRLYDWEGITTIGRQNSETRWVESFLLSISVCPSNRCSKDSSCAHKGLVANWPHHKRAHVLMSVDFYVHFDSVLLRTAFFPFLLSSPISHALLPLSTIMLEDVVDPLRLCWYSCLFSPSDSLVPIYAMPSHVQSASTCLDLSIASQPLPGSL